VGLQGSNTSFALAPQGKGVFNINCNSSIGSTTVTGLQRCAEASPVLHKPIREHIKRGRTDWCILNFL